MQPQNTPTQTPPPQAKPAPASPLSSDVVKMEIEQNIPIKQPQPVQTATTPLAPAKQFVEAGPKADKGLETALKEASHGISDLTKDTAKKPRFSLKSLIVKAKKPKPAKAEAAPPTPIALPAVAAAAPAPASAPKKISLQMPILATAAAFLVLFALSVAALYAFR